MSKIPIRQQIAEVEREIAMRHSVYPRLVAQERMSQAAAKQALDCMAAALATLKWVERHAAALRETPVQLTELKEIEG
jgi:hypothetical protein